MLAIIFWFIRSWKKTSKNWVHSIFNGFSWSGWICRFWRSSTGIIWCSLSDDFCLFSVLGNLVLIENLNFIIWPWYIIILLILLFEVLHFSSQVMHGSNAPLLGRIITEEVNTDPLGRMALMRRLYPWKILTQYSLVDLILIWRWPE